MFWYMCESMEVVSACVAHVCGVCNTVHKYVHCYACYFTCFYYSPPPVCPYFPMVMCVILCDVSYFVTITVTPMKFALSCVLFHALCNYVHEYFYSLLCVLFQL